jgi:TPP-dependent trihydroxycyclohexane-1,2-dione (THcHDO) dehydratase
MADPLSISAGVVGIIVPALHGSRVLLDELCRNIDAPKIFERLKTNLQSVEMALTSLRAVKDTEWELLGDSVAEQSKATIESCTEACKSFRTDIKLWTKHSDGKKLSWKDRANVGFLKQRQIEAMSSQLQTCHIVINSVVGIATLCVATC